MVWYAIYLCCAISVFIFSPYLCSVKFIHFKPTKIWQRFM